MDKETKKFLTKQVANIIDALTEKHNDEVKVFGEQFASIKRTLRQHTTILKANQETLLEHDGKLLEHDKKLEGISSDIKTVVKTTNEIKESLDTKADKADVIKLERRVAVLESRR